LRSLISLSLVYPVNASLFRYVVARMDVLSGGSNLALPGSDLLLVFPSSASGRLRDQ
jgi:hypothetical protein